TRPGSRSSRTRSDSGPPQSDHEAARDAGVVNGDVADLPVVAKRAGDAQRAIGLDIQAAGAFGVRAAELVDRSDRAVAYIELEYEDVGRAFRHELSVGEREIDVEAPHHREPVWVEHQRTRAADMRRRTRDRPARLQRRVEERDEHVAGA